jgi:hypothetical protein
VGTNVLENNPLRQSRGRGWRQRKWVARETDRKGTQMFQPNTRRYPERAVK